MSLEIYTKFMNIYAQIILIALLVDVLLNVVADILNLKALKTELPEEFQGLYDADEYRRSQEYTCVNTRFGFITSLVSLAATLAFWFSGGFNILDVWVRSIDPGPIWSGLIYTGILLFAKSLLSLPFSLYATFVIEERFGFNKTTSATFFADLAKSLALSIVLGGPLLAGVLAFFHFAGEWAWLYCWGAITVFSLFVQFLAPTVIMPLFNKFIPLEPGALKDALLTYAGRVNYPIADIYVMDGSRRSAKSNAFFTGFGKRKRVVFFDTLIQHQSHEELVAILAHEIGHYKKKHILQSMLFSLLHTGAVLFLLSLFLSEKALFDAFYLDNMSVYAGLIIFGMLYTPIEMLLSLVLHFFSRKNEFSADRFAVETTDKPLALVSALKKLSVKNLSNLTPHPMYVFLHYSHPTVLERIEAIRSAADSTSPA